MRTLPTMFLGAALLLMAGCATSTSSKDESSASASCSTYPAVGELPASGSGTPSDPYRGALGILYKGCAVANADPGPIYATTFAIGNYTVTQSNGTTDLELWFYDSFENLGNTVDDYGAGTDESWSFPVDPAGDYGVEVFNNGPGDGPFILIIE